MKENLKALTVLALYTVHEDDLNMNGGRTFYLRPIKATIFIALILLTPFGFVQSGYKGVKDLWIDAFKRVKYSSFYFRKGEKFSKWEAAKKF